VEISDPPFFFAVVKLDGEDYLVVGPVAPVEYGEAEFRKLALIRDVPEEKRDGYCERTMRIAVFSFRQFLATVALLTRMTNGKFISPDDILLSRPFIAREVEKHLAHAMFSARESQVMHTPASFEHYVLQAVTDGNVPKLKQALLSPVAGSIGKMSDDPLRQEKYTFICFITLITRAAIAGGLSQEQAFSLSDIYCQRADRYQDISEIAKLSWDMCMDFTEKVATVKGRDKLSTGISMCCEFINGHLHDDIHLPQLAGLARTSVKTLSKKFKEETGLSVVDYIHQERIKEAQSLLEFSDYSISEIGYYLRYGSQSYFSSIFKKISGVTPQQFRERLKR
jgi:YesN/AraC family two-component response regulator